MAGKRMQFIRALINEMAEHRAGDEIKGALIYLIDNSACESLTRNLDVLKPTEHFFVLALAALQSWPTPTIKKTGPEGPYCFLSSPGQFLAVFQWEISDFSWFLSLFGEKALIVFSIPGFLNGGPRLYLRWLVYHKYAVVIWISRLMMRRGI